MSSDRRRSRWWSAAGRVAVAGLLVAGTVVTAGAAAAGAPDPSRPQGVRPLGSRTAPLPAGVVPQPSTASVMPPPKGEQPKLTLRHRDAKSTDMDTGTTCFPFAYLIGAGVSGYDDFLEEVATMQYAGGISCDQPLDYVSGGVGLVDRSPNFNGQSFNGIWLVSSGLFGFFTTGLSTWGGATVYSHAYNGARIVEPIIQLTLQAPSGEIWQPCGWVPGLTYYLCDGWGTSTLTVVMGAGYTNTGLTQACRDQTVRGDAEEQRMTIVNGSTPASTQIINYIPAIRERVIAFKRDLCSQNSASMNAFMAGQGGQLWTTAVTEARNTSGSAQGRLYDDRPLYWARLSMTRDIAQWTPSFAVNRADLRLRLDRPSRGMASADFTQSVAKRGFVSGFDPFGLDGSGIMSGNPSAAAVLGLDSTNGPLFNGAEVQVVILPVRYIDFNQFLVENTFQPHLAPGPQQATLITTVSQGRADYFDLEYWNGRNRSSGFADNLNQVSNGSLSNPVTPPLQPGAGTAQFTKTTLPLASMQVSMPFPWSLCTHVKLTEVPNPGGTPVTRPSDNLTEQCSLALANSPGPTAGWIASAGSGGGFLSNEIAYRVTELRDRLVVTVPAGHVHVPAMSLSPTPGERSPIVLKYREILAAAIAAT
jgi:pyrrolidone-carboxylate peptidase